MTKILIINGGQVFAHSGGKFNATVSQWTKDFFETRGDSEIKIVNINEPFVPQEEVKKYVWADVIIYHTPVWWFHIPYRLKQYIDEVFTAGHNEGMYTNDGRSRKSDNPKLHYGTGGSMQGRKYMFTSSWNAPEEAFTVQGEFFEQRSVDEVLIGLHKMNQFLGLSRIDGFHFHEMEKGVTDEHISNYKKEYLEHLEKVFGSK